MVMFIWDLCIKWINKPKLLEWLWAAASKTELLKSVLGGEFLHRCLGWTKRVTIYSVIYWLVQRPGYVGVTSLHEASSIPVVELQDPEHHLSLLKVIHAGFLSLGTHRKLTSTDLWRHRTWVLPSEKLQSHRKIETTIEEYTNESIRKRYIVLTVHLRVQLIELLSNLWRTC